MRHIKKSIFLLLILLFSTTIFVGCADEIPLDVDGLGVDEGLNDGGGSGSGSGGSGGPNS